MAGEELIPPEKMNRLLRVAEEASGLLCQIGG
jgi:hypothetical protein